VPGNIITPSGNLTGNYTNRTASEQIGGVKEKIANYLQAFVIAEIRLSTSMPHEFPDGLPLREHILEDALLCFSSSAER
jgi:hypothetical protein